MKVREDVIIFEVRLRAKDDANGPTEAELRHFHIALQHACEDVLAKRGIDQHSDKFEIWVRDVASETFVPKWPS